MINLLVATFPVEPVPWQRATPHPGGRMITAERTREYERTLGTLAKYKMGPMAPFDQPLEVEVTFLMKQPHRFRNRPYPDVANDIDNLLKSTFDALNGVVWKDDCRIISVAARKIWGPGAVMLRVFK